MSEREYFINEYFLNITMTIVTESSYIMSIKKIMYLLE